MTTREWRRALLATAAAGLLTLTACTDGHPSAGARSPAAAAPSADDVSRTEGGPDTFPGLYVTADVVPVTASASQLTLASGRSCRELSAMLAAGQWRRVDRLHFGKLGEQEVAMLAGFGGIPGDLLSRGDRLAFAGLAGDPACTATVSEVASGEVTVAGSGLPGRSAGWVATTRCYRSKSDGTLTVSFYFDTEGRVGGQGQLALSRGTDGYTVADDSSAMTLTLLRHDSRFLDAMSTVYADLRRRPAGLRALVPGDAFTGSAEVNEDSAGVVELAGLVAEDGGGAVEVSLPFSCPTVIEIR